MTTAIEAARQKQANLMQARASVTAFQWMMAKYEKLEVLIAQGRFSEEKMVEAKNAIGAVITRIETATDPAWIEDNLCCRDDVEFYAVFDNFMREEGEKLRAASNA